MATSDLASFSSGSPQSRPRFPVNIEAYVRLSFNEEVELSGWIGEETMVGESRKKLRQIKVASNVGGQDCHLTFGLRRLRGYPVSGQVMGQPVTGHAVITGLAVDFDGMAGQEPLRYRLDPSGGCSSFGQDLGIKVVYQSFHSEILGWVDRIPDAVMVGLLLPIALRRRASAYG